jgi:hypothetical protein
MKLLSSAEMTRTVCLSGAPVPEEAPDTAWGAETMTWLPSVEVGKIDSSM